MPLPLFKTPPNKHNKATSLHHTIKHLLETTLGFSVVLEKPKDKNHGHYATPVAFSLAKELKKNPALIAQELSKKLSEIEVFESVQSVGGYINFRLKQGFLDAQASLALSQGREFGKGNKRGSILLEYVSANPTGPLHIGHARGAVLGDALSRIGRHLGYALETEYYVNDAGNQIHLLGLSIYLAGRDSLLALPVTYPEQYYRGEYIVDIAKEALKKWGEKAFIDEAFIPELSLFGKELMLEEIRSNLADTHIHFDHYVSEKSLYPKWEETYALLQSHQGCYEEGGKVWLRSSAHGDEKDRVIVRESGEPTYLAGDIIYHADKFARPYDRYINIWGADHHGYIARVKAAIEFLGHDSSKLEVLLSQMVTLLKGGQPYKMSKRAGNFILMRDVLEDIGADALRFIFLSKKPDTHLEFDVDDLNKEDSSNPIFYINYAHARIHTMLGKSSLDSKEIEAASLGGLDDSIFDLLFLSLQLPQVLEDSFENRAVQKVAEYLRTLAGEFHKFYNEHKILETPQEAALLKICKVVALSLSQGLALLGIAAKERM